MDAEKTGQLIREKREALRLTQNELAALLHISGKAVSKWERGLSFPDISLLIPLSEILEVSLYDILSGGGAHGAE